MSSETSAFKLQTPGKFPKEHRLHSKHGESLKTTKLKDDATVWESFKIELKNRLQALTDMENVVSETTEEKRRNIRIAFTDASDSVLGLKEKCKKTG